MSGTACLYFKAAWPPLQRVTNVANIACLYITPTLAPSHKGQVGVHFKKPLRSIRIEGARHGVSDLHTLSSMRPAPSLQVSCVFVCLINRVYLPSEC